MQDIPDLGHYYDRLLHNLVHIVITVCPCAARPIKHLDLYVDQGTPVWTAPNILYHVPPFCASTGYRLYH
jgi:hypothetical protein